jgi:hypothetical protein
VGIDDFNDHGRLGRPLAKETYSVADGVLTYDDFCETEIVVPAQGLLSLLRFSMGPVPQGPHEPISRSADTLPPSITILTNSL